MRNICQIMVGLCLGGWFWLGTPGGQQGLSQSHAKSTKRLKRAERRCVRYAKKRRCFRRCLRRQGKRCVKRSRKRTCYRRCLRWERVVVAKQTKPVTPTAQKVAISPGMSPRERAIAGIQNYYQEVQTLCADFKQIFKAARLSRPQTEQGRFYYRKPGMLRFNYTRPEPKDFIYNGLMKTLWMYYPEDKEVKVHYNMERSRFGVAMQFLWGSGDLKRSFRIKLAKDRSFGRPKDIRLALTPKKPQTILRKLYFAVDPNKYMIRETIYTDPAGNRNRFIFTNLRRNQKCSITNKMFRFKRPRGVEKIVVGR